MKYRLLLVIALSLVFVVMILAVVGGAASTAVAQADVPPAEPTVTQAVWTTADNGPGSLRQALNDAVPGDTIYFGGNLSGQIDSAEQHARHHQEPDRRRRRVGDTGYAQR